METKPNILVSSCLLGEPVRYNGGSVRSPWIVDTLAQHATLVPRCPELAMGLPVPREAMRLVRRRDDSATRLSTSKSGIDNTELATTTVARELDALPPDLDGAILTARSPLCGVERVKVYDHNNVPQPEGQGFFAVGLRQRFPALPVIEAGRLTDARQRGHFLLRVFTLARAREVPPRPAALQDFHRRMKFLLLAFGRPHMEALGQIVAAARQPSMAASLAAYRATLADALIKPAKRGATADALQHVYGFLRHKLSDEQKAALRQGIEDYRLGKQSLSITLALLRFVNAEVRDSYIDDQYLFSPVPAAVTQERYDANAGEL